MWQSLQESVKVCAMSTLRLFTSRFSRLMVGGVCAVLVASIALAQVPQEVVVAPGDTLSSIAAAHDVSVEALMQTNALANHRLQAGDILVLPGQPYARATYRVKEGDTLTALAVAFNLSVAELRDINQLENDNLRIGQVLYLTSDGIHANTAIVQPGDTLTDLAQRFNTSVEALQIANNLANTRIFPGQRLSLPSDADTVPDTYVVRSGDTLYDIAVAFNMTTDQLIARNNLDGTIIQVGQELVLNSDTPLEPLQITVRPGDNLWQLARDYEVTVRELRAANNLSAQAILRPGDMLTVPGRVASTSQADVGGSASRSVTVTRGDTLSTIASRYNTSVTALMSANNLQSTRIEAGQVLRIVPASQLQPARPAQQLAAAAAPAPNPPTTSSNIVWPLSGTITSRFGYRRLRIGGSNFHTGLDIDGVTGDPIVAAADGTVTFSGWYGGYGNLVIVQAGNIEYYYAHASSLLVSEGERVRAGQRIARVGTTGRVTGSHLHFEIRVDDNPIDPLPILERRASL